MGQPVGTIPVVGYVLLLVVGLALASLTFICSMGNVPIARYLAMAGIPLGANTTFIYGDLLIPPLVGIYRKSFPAKATWSFLGLFILGALLAGALMDALVGNAFGTMAMGSMELSDRFTLVANVLALAALAAVVIVARGARAVQPSPVEPAPVPRGPLRARGDRGKRRRPLLRQRRGERAGRRRAGRARTRPRRHTRMKVFSKRGLSFRKAVSTIAYIW
ncbi:MAG: permease [Vulcanimicrobiaceae bacterium]